MKAFDMRYTSPLPAPYQDPYEIKFDEHPVFGAYSGSNDQENGYWRQRRAYLDGNDYMSSPLNVFTIEGSGGHPRDYHVEMWNQIEGRFFELLEEAIAAVPEPKFVGMFRRFRRERLRLSDIIFDNWDQTENFNRFEVWLTSPWCEKIGSNPAVEFIDLSADGASWVN